MKQTTEKNIFPRTDFLSTNYTMTTQTINFSKISKDKIAEYIELMREHQLNCVKDGNFIEAELAKQRVIQLKKIQDKKDLIEAKRRQKVDKRKFQENKIQEIKETKKELNEKYAEEMTKLEDSLLELKKNIKTCTKWGRSEDEEWEESWKEIYNPETDDRVKECYKKCKKLKDDKEWYETWTEKNNGKPNCEKTCYKMNKENGNKYENYWGNIIVNYLDNKRMNYVGYINNDKKDEYVNYTYENNNN